MSKLLINEPPLQVLPTLAVTVGLEEAIFLQQLHYWLQKSEHIRDGRPWVYNTYDNWQQQFPFWSRKTIQRIITHLENEKIILTANYNRNSLDRTKWYSIDYDALSDFPKRDDHVDSLTTWSGQVDHMHVDSLTSPIPENTTEITSENTTTTEDEKKDKTPVVVPSGEKKKDNDPSKSVSPPARTDAETVEGIVAATVGTPLQGMIPKSAIPNLIRDYNPDAHPDYPDETDVQGIKRLIRWTVAQMSDTKATPIANPVAFLRARAKKGMDKPAAVFVAEAQDAGIQQQHRYILCNPTIPQDYKDAYMRLHGIEAAV